MPKVKVETTPKLVLWINGQEYAVHRIDTHPEVAREAWRLQKADGECHDVHVDEFGIHCSCPDFLWRRERLGELCKHANSLLDVGLFLQRRSK